MADIGEKEGGLGVGKQRGKCKQEDIIGKGEKADRQSDHGRPYHILGIDKQGQKHRFVWGGGDEENRLER